MSKTGALILAGALALCAVVNGCLAIHTSEQQCLSTEEKAELADMVAQKVVEIQKCQEDQQ